MNLPTFQDWRIALGGHLSSRMVWLLVACAVVTLVVSAISLWRGPRPQRRWVLLALRAGAVAACLMVALEPTLELRRITRVPNHVAVLADVSRSMTVSPPQGGGSRHDRMMKVFDGAASRMEQWRAEGHRLDL